MKKALLIANLGLATVAAASLVYAAVDNAPRSTLMSARDYQAAKKSIDEEARISAIVCKRLTGYEMAVCRTELAAEKNVQLAELESRYLGTVQAKYEARIAHVEGQFSVERARCDAFTQDEREHCLAIATETRTALTREARPAA